MLVAAPKVTPKYSVNLAALEKGVRDYLVDPNPSISAWVICRSERCDESCFLGIYLSGWGTQTQWLQSV